MSAAAAIPRCVNQAAYTAARATCRAQVQKHGICEIPNFIHSEFVMQILKDAEALRHKGLGFRSWEEHNVYLEDGTTKGRTTPVRSISSGSSKVLINQKEIVESRTSADLLVHLHRWTGMRDLLQEAFALPSLHPSTDPYGGVDPAIGKMFWVVDVPKTESQNI